MYEFSDYDLHCAMERIIDRFEMEVRGGRDISLAHQSATDKISGIRALFAIYLNVEALGDPERDLLERFKALVLEAKGA